MHWIDWIIVILPLFVVAYIALKAQRYVKGVADFLTAGRVAGRYVISVATAEAGMGLISLVAMYEAYYKCGFVYSFWGGISAPIGLILGLMGYCIYRFRETRAMTMGQFFEIRYSKSFRIFAAVLQSASGIINYAIFPAVGARFLVYYCDLPVIINIWGWEFQTFGLVMAAFLSVAVIIVTLGGQITIMVTDCIQGLLSYPLYLIVVLFIIWKFSWFKEMAPALLDRPPGKSMLNPFDITKLRDFNLFYVFVGVISSILNRMAWSGTQGYNTAAISAHEQKMGGVLGTWRVGFSSMMYVFLAIAAFTYLHHAHYAPQAKKVRTELAKKAMLDVTLDDPRFDTIRAEVNTYLDSDGKEYAPDLKERVERIRAERKAVEALSNPGKIQDEKKASERKENDSEYMLGFTKDALASEDKAKAQTFGTIFGQMRVPLALRSILPIGITGIFCALAIFLLISTDTTYLHSWGSIVIQDVVLPFRKKPFTPKEQLALLRITIALVAVFAWCFSYVFGQVDYILMFFAITGAIWLGGAGPCIVGGLYWKRGTAWGAFAALSSGAILAVSGILGQNYWVSHIYPWLVETQMIDTVRRFVEGASDPFRPIVDWRVTGEKFPINSQEIYFITMIISVSLYVVLSLLTCKKPFNMDRMLHRGKYQIEGKKIGKQKFTFRRLLGIDDQYTKGDKILAWSVFLWSFGYGFLLCFIGVIVWNVFVYRWPNEWWGYKFFITGLVVPSIVGVVSTVWFTIGGTWDLRRLFRRLAEKETNLLDDGRVIGHVSASDVAMVEELDHVKFKEAHEAEKALADELEREAEELEEEAEELLREGKHHQAEKLEREAEELEREVEELEGEDENPEKE